MKFPTIDPLLKFIGYNPTVRKSFTDLFYRRKNHLPSILILCIFVIDVMDTVLDLTIGASAAFTRFVDVTSNPSAPLDATDQVGVDDEDDDDDGRRSEGYERKIRNLGILLFAMTIFSSLLRLLFAKMRKNVEIGLFVLVESTIFLMEDAASIIFVAVSGGSSSSSRSYSGSGTLELWSLWLTVILAMLYLVLGYALVVKEEMNFEKEKKGKKEGDDGGGDDTNNKFTLYAFDPVTRCIRDTLGTDVDENSCIDIFFVSLLPAGALFYILGCSIFFIYVAFKEILTNGNEDSSPGTLGGNLEIASYVLYAVGCFFGIVTTLFSICMMEEDDQETNGYEEVEEVREVKKEEIDAEDVL